MDAEEKKAYKEVLEVLNNLVEEDYKKIPKEYIKILEEKCDKEYNFKYDSEKEFSEQKIMDRSKEILWGFFEKFGATDKQKELIKRYWIQKKMEEERKKGNYQNDIFKNNNDKKTKELDKNLGKIEEKKSIAVVNKEKENFIIKIINFIKRIVKF